MSYMELLSERARPEPRLRRLLGHVRIYENATRLQQQKMEKSVFSFGEEEEEGKRARDAASGAESGRFRPLTASLKEVERVQTFSEFQAMIRSNLEHQPLCTMRVAEITEDSDESDGSEESEGRESGDEDHGDSISGEGEHRVVERIVLLQKAFMLRDREGLAVEVSSYPITKGEQDDDPRLWERAPMLRSSGREEALYDVWL